MVLGGLDQVIGVCGTVFPPPPPPPPPPVFFFFSFGVFCGGPSRWDTFFSRFSFFRFFFTLIGGLAPLPSFFLNFFQYGPPAKEPQTGPARPTPSRNFPLQRFGPFAVMFWFTFWKNFFFLVAFLPYMGELWGDCSRTAFPQFGPEARALLVDPSTPPLKPPAFPLCSISPSSEFFFLALALSWIE